MPSAFRWFSLPVILGASAFLAACGSGGAGSSANGAAAGGGYGGASGAPGGGSDADAGGQPGAGSGGANARDAALSDGDSSSGVRAPAFLKIRLSADFYSEGISYGDLDRDGKQDIIAGPYWYPGPDYTSKVPFRLPRATPFDPTGDSDCYSIFVFDMNQDGWLDIVSLRLPGGSEALWYENPKVGGGYWTEHLAFSAVHDESPSFADIDGDGKP